MEPVLKNKFPLIIYWFISSFIDFTESNKFYLKNCSLKCISIPPIYNLYYGCFSQETPQLKLKYR